MIRRPPRSTLSSSSAASDVYKRQLLYILLYTQVCILPDHLHSNGLMFVVLASRNIFSPCILQCNHQSFRRGLLCIFLFAVYYYSEILRKKQWSPTCPDLIFLSHNHILLLLPSQNQIYTAVFLLLRNPFQDQGNVPRFFQNHLYSPD